MRLEADSLDTISKAVLHVIDCDAEPFIPEDWEVEEHIRGGRFKFNPSQLSLFLTDEQRAGTMISGSNLRKKLKGKPVLNANVLDYLLIHPELISVPDHQWKNRRVYFWGTIYCDTDGHFYVRCLRWHSEPVREGNRWHPSHSWLRSNFGLGHPAAVYASN